MRWFGVLLIIVATLATTTSVRAEDWTLADGKTLKNVVIVAQEGDGVRVTYDGGVGKFPYYELPDPIIIRLGQDPATMAIKRAAARKAQAEATLQEQQDAAAAAELKKQQADAAAVDAAMKAAQGQAPTPAPAPGVAPGTAPGGAPGTAPGTAATPSTPGTSPSPNSAAPRTTANATPAPAPAPAPVAPTPPQPPPGPVFPALPPGAVASSGPTDEQQATYPNSKFQYDENADISYLDSPVVAVEPMAADAAPTPAPGAPAAPSPNGSLYLRIITEGHRAEAPDETEGVFLSPVMLKNPATCKVVFLVDGAFIPTTLPEADDSTVNQPGTQVTFFLTSENMKTLLSGKKVNVKVGTADYGIDDSGLASLRAFLNDVNHLPSASTNFVRAYHHLVNRLPSIVTMISAACEYIILGAFGLVMVAAIAAFIMGLTRFIKM